MRRITDQLLIMTYCFILACSVALNTGLVISFLLALIYISVMALVPLPNQYWHLSFSLSFLLFCCFVPNCLFFSPLIFYQLDPKRQLWSMIATGLAVTALTLYMHLPSTSTTAAFLLFGTIGAVYAAQQTKKINSLTSILQTTRDDGMELTLLLQENNRSLREKQDDEIYTATLKERNRIAREIHDNVGHVLSRAILITGAIKLTNQTEQLTLPLENLDHSLNEAMTSIRTSVHDLHDEAIDLEKALNDIVSDFTFCQINFTYHLGQIVPKAVKYNVIAIVKEALNNVIKHSQAQKVTLSITESEDLFQVIITDDGPNKGLAFDTANFNQDTHGIGLLNMTERVKKLKGTITFYQQNGFKIFIKIPKT